MKTGTWGLLGAMIAIAFVCLLHPEPACAAEGGGGRWGVWLFIGRVFNILLVILVLIWVARRPLSEFYASRSRSIREQLSEAQRAREAAEARLADTQSRLALLHEELAQIREAAERDAQEEHRRLVAEAERDAARIMERARQEIDGMTRAAQLELKRHAAELTVQLAENRIRREIDDADRSRLVARFVGQLGERR